MKTKQEPRKEYHPLNLLKTGKCSTIDRLHALSILWKKGRPAAEVSREIGMVPPVASHFLRQMAEEPNPLVEKTTMPLGCACPYFLTPRGVTVMKGMISFISGLGRDIPDTSGSPEDIPD
tara:strand:- start:422 stop:781 length:360 start_codon:yes stop_codon:yes gene_type:complete